MQMYEGLPIITNKITHEERGGVPHHLLGCVRLDEEPWRVGKFVKTALEIIKGIQEREKVPILVGGTHYYTQSLLFNDKLADMDSDGDDAIPDKVEVVDSTKKWPILEAATPEILAKLREVDPIMADRWHPEDRRKIRRSLEIYLQTGKRASEIYEKQQRKRQEIGTEDHNTSSDLRFPTLFLWVHTPAAVLTPRLDRRVDAMMTSGLLSEVLSLSSLISSESLQNNDDNTTPAIDQTRGIWVSIGYKEFSAYTTALQDPTSSTTPSTLAKLKADGVDRTKIATRQYAKRQVKWIRSKLLYALRNDASDLASTFVLDSSRASTEEEWTATVQMPATRITHAFLHGEQLPRAVDVCAEAGELLSTDRGDLSARRDLWVRRTCESCGVTAVTPDEWERHASGRKHRLTVAHVKRVAAAAAATGGNVEEEKKKKKEKARFRGEAAGRSGKDVTGNDAEGGCV